MPKMPIKIKKKIRIKIKLKIRKRMKIKKRMKIERGSQKTLLTSSAPPPLSMTDKFFYMFFS